MDQARVAIDGILSTRLFEGLPKRAALPSPQGWIAGLSALAVLPLMLLLTAEPAAPPAVQSVRNAAPPPTGIWHCSLAGETVGMLTVDGWRYTLAIDGEQPAGGTLAPVGGQALKNKAAYVRVESGPLKDGFGISLGFHDDAAEPENLIFSVKPGSGVHCLSS